MNLHLPWSRTGALTPAWVAYATPWLRDDGWRGRSPGPLLMQLSPAPLTKGSATMYGLIGKMTAVALDSADPDPLWITEVWDSPASHQASLALPGVQAAIAKGRPLIAGFSNRVETTPIGGQGLKAAGPG